jgi:hypothetical protein
MIRKCKKKQHINIEIVTYLCYVSTELLAVTVRVLRCYTKFLVAEPEGPAPLVNTTVHKWTHPVPVPRTTHLGKT